MLPLFVRVWSEGLLWSKLFSVVRSDGMQPGFPFFFRRNPLDKVLRVASYTCSAVLLFRGSILTIPVALQLIVSSTPLSQRDALGMIFANDCIDFQVAKPVFFFYDVRSLFNVYSIDNHTSVVFQATSFPVSFASMSQVFKKTSSSKGVPWTCFLSCQMC